MKVTIVDYGMGNIFSVSRALEHCGADVLVTSEPDAIVTAERLLLPGVGAFGHGMAELRSRRLVEPIRQFIEKSGRPFLGICLGMQMLFEESEEAPGVSGLSAISGRVVRIPDRTPTIAKLKVPNIGWSPLRWRDRDAASRIAGGERTTLPEAYFVHSYMAQPARPEVVAATIDYGGLDVTAAVLQQNLVGTQFHPEKSGPFGLTILRKFLA